MANYFVHDRAIVETEKIGEGSRIWANVHILPGAQIGKNANICDVCFIENDVVLGDNVTVKCNVSIWDGIHAEDDVFIGPSVAFTNDLLPRSKNTAYTHQKTLLRKGCSIGANATILGGVTIGAYAMIGAGSVVTKNVPDFTLVYGNPATFRSYICVCAEKLTFSDKTYTCSCGRVFRKEDQQIVLEKDIV